MDRVTFQLIYVRRVIVTLVNTIGPERAMGAARWLAQGAFDLETPARKRAELNLSRAYGNALSSRERSELIRRVFENIAAFWVEVFLSRRKLRCSSWRRFVEFDDEPFLRSIAQSPRGAILVTAYFGNFAVGAYALGQIFRPLYVVIDELRHPVLKSWQDELCRQPNIRLLPRHRTRGRLADLLRAGQKVLLIGEHVRLRGRAVEVNYLGRPCRCYPTVGVLARWCDVPVVAVAARREAGVFRFCVSSVMVADPRGLDPQPNPVDTITARYIHGLEAIIRRWPEQYLWTRDWEPPQEAPSSS